VLHRSQTESHIVYFCTVTCFEWLPLFAESNCYDSVYRWFHHLKSEGCHVVGYVIMPNHFHVLLYPTLTSTSLSKLVGAGKRFMAYDIVNSLQKQNKHLLLEKMQMGVQRKELMKGKKHQVFRLSFDARKCFTEKMLLQKLDYIHHNPVKGKWNLAEDFTLYEHSSAGFYETDKSGRFMVTHFKDLGDAGSANSSESSFE